MYQATAFALSVIQGQRPLHPKLLAFILETKNVLFFAPLTKISWESQRASIIYRMFFFFN
jgi:hypothetical protein